MLPLHQESQHFPPTSFGLPCRPRPSVDSGHRLPNHKLSCGTLVALTGRRMERPQSSFPAPLRPSQAPEEAALLAWTEAPLDASCYCPASISDSPAPSCVLAPPQTHRSSSPCCPATLESLNGASRAARTATPAACQTTQFSSRGSPRPSCRLSLARLAKAHPFSRTCSSPGLSARTTNLRLGRRVRRTRPSESSVGPS